MSSLEHRLFITEILIVADLSLVHVMCKAVAISYHPGRGTFLAQWFRSLMGIKNHSELDMSQIKGHTELDLGQNKGH